MSVCQTKITLNIESSLICWNNKRWKHVVDYLKICSVRELRSLRPRTSVNFQRPIEYLQIHDNHQSKMSIIEIITYFNINIQ